MRLRDLIEGEKQRTATQRRPVEPVREGKSLRESIIDAERPYIKPRSYKMLSQNKDEEMAVVKEYIRGVPLAVIYETYNITKDALYKSVYAEGLVDKSSIRDVVDLSETVDRRNIHKYLDLPKETVTLILDTLEEEE